MANKATVYKAELQISDMDRHYYATHALTVAQHPSETDERLMARLLAFVLFAKDRLEFGRGISSDDEPDLWVKSLTGEIELWIDLGQPEESRIRRVCGRAREVIIVTYSGRGADLWWEKNTSALARIDHLSVVDLPYSAVQELGQIAERSMSLQCLIQDGQTQIINATKTITIEPVWRKRAR
jgi:uncharacterized protein YaeQ